MSQKAPNSGKARASSSLSAVDGGGSVACPAHIGLLLLLARSAKRCALRHACSICPPSFGSPRRLLNGNLCCLCCDHRSIRTNGSIVRRLIRIPYAYQEPIPWFVYD